MSEREDFRAMVDAIKLYTDHFGYGLQRTETGPEYGQHPFATKLTFSAFQAEFTIHLDKEGESWQVSALMKDSLGKPIFQETASSDKTTVDAAKTVGAMLSKLPANAKRAADANEAWLESFQRSTVYLIEKELSTLFE